MLKKTRTLFALLVVSVFIAGAVPAQAFDRFQRDRKCEERINRAEYHLREAIRKHGERSRQAEKRRRELEEIREHCRYRH